MSEAPGPESRRLRARETLPKTSSMTVVRVGVDGSSGAIARLSALWRRRSLPGNQTTVSRPSWLQRASLTFRISVWACLTGRINMLLRRECAVGAPGGARCDALDLARIDIYVNGLTVTI